MDKNIILGTTVEQELDRFDEVHKKLTNKIAKSEKIAEIVLNAAIEYELALEKELEEAMFDYEKTLEDVLNEVNAECPTEIEELHDLIVQQQSVFCA